LTVAGAEIKTQFACCETYEGSYLTESLELQYGTYSDGQVNQGSAKTSSLVFDETAEIQIASVSLSSLVPDTDYWFQVRSITTQGPGPAVPAPPVSVKTPGSSSSSSGSSGSSSSGSSSSSDLPWCEELVLPGVECKCGGFLGNDGQPCSELVPLDTVPRKDWPIHYLYPGNYGFGGGPPANPGKWDSKGYWTCAYRNMIFGHRSCSCCFEEDEYGYDPRGCFYQSCKYTKQYCYSTELSCNTFNKDYVPNIYFSAQGLSVDDQGNAWDGDGYFYEWDGTSYVPSLELNFSITRTPGGTPRGGYTSRNCSESHPGGPWKCPSSSSSSTGISSSSSGSSSSELVCDPPCESGECCLDDPSNPGTNACLPCPSNSSSGSSGGGEGGGPSGSSSSSLSLICDPSCEPTECCLEVVPGLNVCTPCGSPECPCPSSSSSDSNSSSSSSIASSSSSSPCPCAGVYLTCTIQCAGNCPKITVIPCPCGPGVDALICDCDTKPCPYGGWSRNP
jgi:hypothetical protein